MLSSTIYFFCNLDSNDKQLTKYEKDKGFAHKVGSAHKVGFAHHIVSSNFFSLNEISIANKIRTLNSQNGFRFYIFDKAEHLKIGEIGHYNLDANIVRSNAHKILLTFAKRDLVYFDAYLSSLSSSKKYILNLIEGYRVLLHSINLLVSNQIIHNNLNSNTIVFEKTVVLTNFSFSVDLQNSAFNWSQYFLQKKLNKFSPIEFYLLQYQLTNKQEMSMYNIETVVRQFLKEHNFLDLNTDFNYFSRYANKSFVTNLEEALKHWKTWDNYALSVAFLDILQTTFKKSDNKFIMDFMKLLVSYINLDPSKRGTLSLTSFEELLRNLSITDFKELF